MLVLFAWIVNVEYVQFRNMVFWLVWNHRSEASFKESNDFMFPFQLVERFDIFKKVWSLNASNAAQKSDFPTKIMIKKKIYLQIFCIYFLMCRILETPPFLK